MLAFRSKAAPSPVKLRGGYYTPAPVARFLGSWVARGGLVLEPSCGDGAILAALEGGADRAIGIELLQEEAEAARARCVGSEVLATDFFRWFDDGSRGAFDGVAGNPPFIRFQHWSESTRELAFDLMRSVGMKPSRLTNAWVPFAVASALAVREGGRLGLVLPAELLQVGYSAELRGFLVDCFQSLTVVTFRRLLFQGILQEVVLLLGTRGEGPAHVRVVEVDDAEALPDPNTLKSLTHAPALRHDTEKWTKYLLTPGQINTLRSLRDRPDLHALRDFGEVDVGIVTGRNQFFVIRPSEAYARSIERYALPLVSKSAHLQGVSFTPEDLAALERTDGLCRLLAVDDALDIDTAPALRSYIEAGELADVHAGYKCSIRRRWWVVPSVWRPDAFLLRQIYSYPRAIANFTDATATDTIHRVRIVNGTSPAAFAAASINSCTFAFAEVMGRSYGGGVLELEPREAEALPFPDPAGLTNADVAAVDRLLRVGALDDALALVDQRLLIEGLGLDRAVVNQLRSVWVRLRDRRLARGRHSRAGERPAQSDQTALAIA